MGIDRSSMPPNFITKINSYPSRGSFSSKTTSHFLFPSKNDRLELFGFRTFDLASTPQRFQISASTDRLQVRFFVQEDCRIRDAVDSLERRYLEIRNHYQSP